MKVSLPDGRIATAHNVFAGKQQQITLDGELTYWPREQLTPVTDEPALTVTKVPAIERLLEFEKYLSVIWGDQPMHWPVEVQEEHTALQTETREEFRKLYGL